MDDTTNENWSLAEMARRLDASGDYRVLLRIDETTLNLTPVSDNEQTRVGVVIDVETEGLGSDHAIIELAVRRFRFNDAGRITAIGEVRVWREDPGRPLDPAITTLTGLTDADLAGQTIDDAAAAAILTSADIVIAHNACFDRPRVESRLPEADNLAWGCSCKDVDWSGLGFDGRSLGYLLTQMGWFYPQHRAETDILALLHLLTHELGDGTTVLSQLVAEAEKPTVRVEAIDTPYATKDALKARGYTWQPNPKLWWIEVDEDDVVDEQLWLQRNGCHRAPHLTKMTWLTRHR